MKKKTILLIFLLFLSVTLFSQHFDMITTGDSILEDIRFLSIESGVSFLSFTPPLAPGEIKLFLDSINDNELSIKGREAYFRILNRLNPTANISYSINNFSAFFNINSTLEGRVRFNSKVDEYPKNPNINSFLSFPIYFFFSDSLQLFVEPSYTMRPDKYELKVFDINIPLDYFEYDDNMPLKAFIAAGGDWWSFQLGRDRLFWGSGNTVSLTFSDNSQYFDFARYSLFSSVFKYSFIINQLPLTLKRNLFPGKQEYDDWWNDVSNRTSSEHRYFYLHRIDFKLFNKISIGVMEGIMIGNSPIELKYLNPLVIFHSFFAWRYQGEWNSPGDGNEPGDMAGSFLSLELNWNIINNLAIYGQFVMNEYAEPGELKRNPNQPPNALGYIAGIQYSHSFNSWASVFFLEFIYTDPYLYILSSPYGSFIQQNRFGQNYYLGYQRDTIAFVLGAKFTNFINLNFNGTFSWITSGEHNKEGLVWKWERSKEAYNERTPTGAAENQFILSLGAGWKALPFLTLNTTITGILSVNNRNEKGNTEIGGQASFSAGFYY